MAVKLAAAEAMEQNQKQRRTAALKSQYV